MKTEHELRQKLSHLIGLLSCNDIDEHETSRIVSICLQAIDKPADTLRKNYGADAAKVAEYDPAGVTAFIVYVELEDYFAVADTVDELYEEILAAFEHPAMPPYPYDNNDFETVSDFYQWVDQQLQLHHDKYCLISFGESYSHDFQTILIYRTQLEVALALCQELGLQAEPCQ